MSYAQSSKEKIDFSIKQILLNPKVIEHNGKLWSVYHDTQLFEYVIKYNFNFFKIANSFQNVSNHPEKYSYNEDAVRLHWSFLHAMRYTTQDANEAYYNEMKLKYEQKKKTFKEVKKIIPQPLLSEEEELKRRQESIEKSQEDRYQLIGKPKKQEPQKPEKTKEEKEAELKKEEEELTIENPIKEIKIEENKIELKKDDNEDDYIKKLFSKNIPIEIKEKLMKDKEKYKKEEEIDEDQNLFPIKTIRNESEENNEDEILNTQSIESQLKGTKNIDDFIEENKDLKKQYDQLNTYYNFAVKSLNHIVHKTDNDEDSLEGRIINKTNEKLNELILGPMMTQAKEEFTLEKFNHKINGNDNDDDTDNDSNQLSHYDNYMKQHPLDQDQNSKVEKFKKYLFSSAENMSTMDLFDKISNIIEQTKLEEIQSRNEEEEKRLNPNIIENTLNQLNLQMNYNNNNNINEDNKSEITKEQSLFESNCNQTNNNDNNDNNATQSEIQSIDPKKYQKNYKGIVYYMDKPVDQQRDQGYNSEDSYNEDK